MHSLIKRGINLVWVGVLPRSKDRRVIDNEKCSIGGKYRNRTYEYLCDLLRRVKDLLRTPSYIVSTMESKHVLAKQGSSDNGDELMR